MMRALVALIQIILVIGAIVFGLRRATRHSDIGKGHWVRRFFQYLLMYVLLLLSSIGLSGLLSRILEKSVMINGSQSDLARNLSFAIVAIPLYAGLAIWTRRGILGDSEEASSFAWHTYLALSSATSLLVAMFSLHQVLSWMVGNSDYRGASVARLVVWGAVWEGHWWVQTRVGGLTKYRAHLLLGTLISFAGAEIGLARLITAGVEKVWLFNSQSFSMHRGSSVLGSLVSLVVAAPLWYLYWIRHYSKAKRDLLWSAHVMLFGIGLGLLMALGAASSVLYSVLIWFFGNKNGDTAAMVFRDVPTAIGIGLVGALSWYYHRAVLAEKAAERNEIRRVYEYLMAAIGLLAAAAGLSMAMIALMETASGSSVIVGPGSKNAYLAAITLLILGIPIWRIFWRNIQRSLQSPDEQNSPTRRTYLFLLIGIGGVVAVITLVTCVYFAFEDTFNGVFGLETLRRVRFPLAMLLTTAAISGYHWSIYRGERDLYALGNHGPSLVLLIGPEDRAVIDVVKRITGGQVQVWWQTDVEAAHWPQEELAGMLTISTAKSVVVTYNGQALTISPIEKA